MTKKGEIYAPSNPTPYTTPVPTDRIVVGKSSFIHSRKKVNEKAIINLLNDANTIYKVGALFKKKNVKQVPQASKYDIKQPVFLRKSGHINTIKK